MDYKELIENHDFSSPAKVADWIWNTTCAITALLARAEAAEDRVEKAERALAHMWYAYENKDGEFPHEYEKESVAQAEKILGKWEDVMPNMMKEE